MDNKNELNTELNSMLQKVFKVVTDAYIVALNEVNEVCELKEKVVVGKVKDYALVTSWHDAEVIITQATRLSDNEIFKVKDRTDEGVIKGFYEYEENLWVRFEERGGVVSLNDIEKVKEREVLFTTEDLVPIYENDNFWMIFTAPNGIGNAHATKARPELLPLQSYQKTFSTEDKAKEWLLLNKPSLSVQDIINISTETTFNTLYIYVPSLKELANKKINNQ